MNDPVIAALTAAWRTTFVAVSLFMAVLALSLVWDTQIYMRALHDALAQTPM